MKRCIYVIFQSFIYDIFTSHVLDTIHEQWILKVCSWLPSHKLSVENFSCFMFLNRNMKTVKFVGIFLLRYTVNVKSLNICLKDWFENLA